MPREQVQWSMKESIDDNKNNIHAQQSCTYYSIVNVNKNNYPFMSSYEKEQTWTLTRTISNNHQRYQSSIENIHLTVPTTNGRSSKAKRVSYENIPIKRSLTNSIFPAQKFVSSTSLQPIPIHIQSNNNPVGQKICPVKTAVYENSKVKSEDRAEKQTRPFSKPMRVIHSNGEFVVRI